MATGPEKPFKAGGNVTLRPSNTYPAGWDALVGRPGKVVYVGVHWGTQPRPVKVVRPEDATLKTRLTRPRGPEYDSVMSARPNGFIEVRFELETGTRTIHAPAADFEPYPKK